MLAIVAKGLKNLKQKVVFVGGATVDLFISDPASPATRATDDVDCVVEIARRGEYYALEDELRALGFQHPMDERAPICRWRRPSTSPGPLCYNNRVTLDAGSLESALAQLEKSVSYLNSKMALQDSGLREQFRAASIQAYEFTYELAVKMIRRQLAEIMANPGEAKGLAFMDAIRAAAEAGLVNDASAFKRYRDARNLTSHTYDSRRAEEIVGVLEPFVADVRFLIGELKRRNAAG